MDRNEFVALVAVVLFVAFLLGWVASWLVGRLGRVTQSNMTDLDEMASKLHEAEEQREQAIAYLHEREHELEARLHETEAELRAAMDGLREAREDIATLRRYIESIGA